jgi:hypothetical protein
MSNIQEFGFDNSKVVRQQGMETFKQNKGDKHRISVIAFKTYHDVVLANKAREAERPLTDAEKADFITKIDAKLAKSLNKDPGDLTEVDRLDTEQPRFSVAFTHYDPRVGTIRCLSGYEDEELVRPELCCKEIGDASQSVATIIMTYPVDEHLQADMDLLKARKYTNIRVYRMSAKKFKALESTYIGARSEGVNTPDLKITLDGDPKFQNQKIESGGTAAWAREGTDPEIRQWVLEQGLRSYKNVASNLGFEITKERLIERLSGDSDGGAQLSGGDASAAVPKLGTNYDSLLKI